MKNCEDNSAKYRACPSAGQTGNPYLSRLFKTDDQGLLIMQPGTFMIQKLYNKTTHFPLKTFLDCMNRSLVRISSLLHMFGWRVLLENKWRIFSAASDIRQQPKPPLFLLKMYPVLSDLGWDFFGIASPPIREAARLIN